MDKNVDTLKKASETFKADTLMKLRRSGVYDRYLKPDTDDEDELEESPTGHLKKLRRNVSIPVRHRQSRMSRQNLCASSCSEDDDTTDN